MTTPTQPFTTESSTFTAEGALPSIDAELLEAVVGGCAACGTPGVPCAPPGLGASPAAASLFAAAFARR